MRRGSPYAAKFSIHMPSVRRALGRGLPFCMTTCDGCGHCGAGVPRGETKCYGEADAFVEGVLAAARARVE